MLERKKIVQKKNSIPNQIYGVLSKMRVYANTSEQANLFLFPGEPIPVQFRMVLFLKLFFGEK